MQRTFPHGSKAVTIVVVPDFQASVATARHQSVNGSRRHYIHHPQTQITNVRQISRLGEKISFMPRPRRSI